MKFYPTPMIRFYIRYAALFIFVVIPAYALWASALEAPWKIKVLAIVAFGALLVGGCTLVNILWEKLFATIEVGNQEITWKCPFRKTQVIPLSECVYAGVETEESHNGLPYPFIYVSCIGYPTAYKNRINRVKNNEHFIKFWYSEELCKCLEKKLPKGTAGGLTAYRIRSKHTGT